MQAPLRALRNEQLPVLAALLVSSPRMWRFRGSASAGACVAQRAGRAPLARALMRGVLSLAPSVARYERRC